MITVEACDRRNNQIHMAAPGSVVTLCGIDVGRMLPFIPVHRFGIVVTLESEEIEYDWCNVCGRCRPRAPSYDATQQRYWKEDQALLAN